MKATFVRKLTENYRGDARLYKVAPAHEGSEYVQALRNAGYSL